MSRPLALSALLASGALCCAAMLAAAQNHAGAPPAAASSWRVPLGNAQRGAELAQTCLTCHGEDAPRSDPPAPKLRHQRASYIFAALLEYRSGARKSDLMEPMAQGLSDQDARDLAVYLSGDMFDRPPRARTDLPAYRRVAQECTWCHGETGIGEFEGMPVLTGQDPAYVAHALRAYREGTRTNPIMRSVVRDLAPGEEQALADYYAAHEWLEAAR